MNAEANTIELWYTTGKNLRTAVTANSMQYVEEPRKRGLSRSIKLWLELPSLSHYYRCKPDCRMHAYTAGARQFAVNRKVALTSSRELRHDWLQQGRI